MDVMWPSQRADLNLNENLLNDLKVAFHQQKNKKKQPPPTSFSSNNSLKRSVEKIQVYRHVTVVAANGINCELCILMQ